MTKMPNEPIKTNSNICIKQLIISDYSDVLTITLDDNTEVSITRKQWREVSLQTDLYMTKLKDFSTSDDWDHLSKLITSVFSQSIPKYLKIWNKPDKVILEEHTIAMMEKYGIPAIAGPVEYLPEVFNWDYIYTNGGSSAKEYLTNLDKLKKDVIAELPEGSIELRLLDRSTPTVYAIVPDGKGGYKFPNDKIPAMNIFREEERDSVYLDNYVNVPYNKDSDRTVAELIISAKFIREKINLGELIVDPTQLDNTKSYPEDMDYTDIYGLDLTEIWITRVADNEGDLSLTYLWISDYVSYEHGYTQSVIDHNLSKLGEVGADILSQHYVG